MSKTTSYKPLDVVVKDDDIYEENLGIVKNANDKLQICDVQWMKTMTLEFNVSYDEISIASRGISYN